MTATGEWTETTDNIDAILIPLGTPVVIPKGAKVRISQQLGGSYTVEVNGNLARVEGRDAVALGLTDSPTTAASNETQKRDSISENSSCVVNEALVLETLKQCYDPEIPVNIVDLGLVYDALVIDNDRGETIVEVTMTLTAPGCGMGPFIIEDVRSRIMNLPGVADVEVELVFDPPWDRSMMSEMAKLQLGMF
ncbi:MAG: putative Fe-S cluster assembly protein SufT [Mariprofundales bacterium]|nr:putative Fe-S cluster assembly protein SufT [Mariprofundales bacterium]